MCLFIGLSFLSASYLAFLGSMIDLVNQDVLKQLFLPVAKNYVPIFGTKGNIFAIAAWDQIQSRSRTMIRKPYVSMLVKYLPQLIESCICHGNHLFEWDNGYKLMVVIFLFQPFQAVS